VWNGGKFSFFALARKEWSQMLSIPFLSIQTTASSDSDFPQQFALKDGYWEIGGLLLVAFKLRYLGRFKKE